MNLYCHKQGLHRDEPLEMICVNEECLDRVLNCVVCVEEAHCGHQLMHYSKFSRLLQKQGPKLLSECDVREGPANDLQTKVQKLITELTQLQEQLNETIERHKTQLNKKLDYYAQFSQRIPQIESFAKAIKLQDRTTVQKLLTQFFQKVAYNVRNQEFMLKATPTEDKSEEIEGQNNLISKIQATIQLFKIDRISRNNTIDTRSNRAYQKIKSVTQSEFIPRQERNLNAILSSSAAFDNRSQKSVSNSPSPGIVWEDRLSIYSQSQQGFKLRSPSKIFSEQFIGPVPIKFQFHNEFFAEGIQLQQQVARLTLDKERRLALIKPPIWGSGSVREVSIKLRIIKCANINERYPMAIGICDLPKVRKDTFIFAGYPEHIPGSAKRGDHGCYLLNSQGAIRSLEQDMTKSNPVLKFYSSSVIQITFNPFNKLLIINRDSNQQISIPIELTAEQKFHFCVRLSNLNDAIEIIQ